MRTLECVIGRSCQVTIIKNNVHLTELTNSCGLKIGNIYKYGKCAGLMFGW